MRVVSLAEVKAKLSAYLQEAEESGPIVITRNGTALAVILAPADDDHLEGLVLSRSPRFRGLPARSRADIRDGRSLTHEELGERGGERNERHGEMIGAVPLRASRSSRAARSSRLLCGCARSVPAPAPRS